MSGMRGTLQALQDFWRFTRQTRKYALFFLVLMLLFLGGIILLTERSVLMPFIYTIF